MSNLVTDFSLITGLVFMLYDQFVRGEVLRKNEPRAVQLLTEYLKSKIID
jgi:hypothetical protein